jgi:hypothetical protein
MYGTIFCPYSLALNLESLYLPQQTFINTLNSVSGQSCGHKIKTSLYLKPKVRQWHIEFRSQAVQQQRAEKWEYSRNILLKNLRHTCSQMMLRPYPKLENNITISRIIYFLVKDFESRVCHYVKPDHLKVRVWRKKNSVFTVNGP